MIYFFFWRFQFVVLLLKRFCVFLFFFKVDYWKCFIKTLYYLSIRQVFLISWFLLKTVLIFLSWCVFQFSLAGWSAMLWTIFDIALIESISEGDCIQKLYTVYKIVCHQMIFCWFVKVLFVYACYHRENALVT